MAFRKDHFNVLRKPTTKSLLITAMVSGMISCGGNDYDDQLTDSSALNSNESVETPAAAMATLVPASNSNASGEVRFYPIDGALMVEVTAMGLQPGSHGFHIHAVGDCSATDASSAGSHFAPDGNMHGAPQEAVGQHHAGDLGNIEASVTGVAQYQRSSTALSLTGTHSVIGKAVIIHAEQDDLQTQPSGDAGDRIACGVITAVSELPETELRVSRI